MNINKVINASSISEIVDLLNEYKDKAKIIAGGTDVVIALRDGKISPEMLIDISKVKELREVKDDGEYLTIGGGVTFTDIVESPVFDGNLYGFKKSCHMVGSPQIRNKGTVGGNIANGSSAADSVPPLMALDSEVILVSGSGERRIGLEDYYHDKIRPDELLVGVRFKKPKKNEVVTFSKLGLRKALAISRLTLSSFIGFDGEGKVETVRIGSGALAKYPMREVEVEEYLMGKKLSDETIELAIGVLKDSMDERLKGRSTLPYKRVAISTILKEALDEAMEFEKGMRA